ncbi:LysR family transcriptional regulator [Streptomyces zagrosensis]|uniref:DNA-binding transcriptional LysR family regulator n=1 Tax=Streptomyces zagrosensis TaxID=1042984 RepID=A0A7W9Q400_9ACTN|nr:LysR family transcriptional regulator [Streptomyces zagrosensis]MBB5933203.1 DNA-binding transcriptional LysR family regulator [Streptomyces zagrosensis]
MRHLRALCAIADAGSVRKAALQLGMTQPSLTTQLRRIENAIGGLLFTREQSGSQPTPLGRSVLTRARPIVADMSALVTAAKDAAAHASGAHLRIGSTGNRAVAGWLRKLHARLPDADTTIHVDVSATMLLQMVATHQLDIAFVHEFAGFPLPVPGGVERRILVAKEPQFIALSASHPAAGRPVVRLSDLANDRWVVDLTVDDECAALRRVLSDAGLNPRMVHVRDNTTAAELVASGEAVSPCQPTTVTREGMVIRPLLDDPLTVRLFTVSRPQATTGPDADALHADLKSAYLELAWANTAYRLWLLRHNSALLSPDEVASDDRARSATASRLTPTPITLPVPGPAPESAPA